MNKCGRVEAGRGGGLGDAGRACQGKKARRIIEPGEWICFYNTERPHSSLDGQTPREAYWRGRPVGTHRPNSNKKISI